ncbi:MAG: RpiB/LacA/LacB family sugar-phosphate isomerase [Candidatus Magasanikbacteria bacterium]|jgi:ribose 5-phosphate isomerase B|nr:RpiB/LacA/LacB family sugar-phosphate isomerase [Candidatus Magasanikbacteria bacterium]MBT4350345.1 RpiB/LacA/LacB family sugar-phosphate isomerase [Candidatus Magasanikbacteria bacterium]MBT4542192.1 RpiB/LacA/LacB family sugar-phosphate isomerase [Candidatus Magasanikbacteria bacterium]MBT6252795.1 RpiB/LacA/LacB family sugar-phosphate isomerase [Candidatus Magasanikbacteria bacterium]MBT7755183.1 RpiB/LacA/LacB family sugar-phosphate isomerase [Candidatus Magasanikbacteria bacterium]
MRVILFLSSVYVLIFLMYTGPLFIASDHGGYQLKKRLIRYIENELNQKVEDMGPSSFEDDDDYPDYVVPLAHKVIEQKARGIVICRNGIGASIAVNKVAGIRAGIGYNLGAAETMMTDDNTNVLALASHHLSDDHAMAILKKWLTTPFSDEPRHVRRLEKVQALES